jgi:hypothetical protein
LLLLLTAPTVVNVTVNSDFTSAMALRLPTLCV